MTQNQNAASAQAAIRPQGDARLVLGVESSCDETAAALVAWSETDGARVLSDVVADQIDAHAPYGGVVPEIAARAHAEKLDGVIAQAMAESGADWAVLDGVAATAGPGLIGGVMAGLLSAKAIAYAHDLPLIAVNHLEGHALSPFLTDTPRFPYLLLLVSGGHAQILVVEDVGRVVRWGSTIDDAVGEAFDKTAKLLGLGFPGGPHVEAWALRGDPTAFDLPRPLLDKPGLDFSFAGLKTAVRRAWERSRRHDADKADVCASFQRAAADVLAHRAGQAMDRYQAAYGDRARTFVVAGGVAANGEIRARLKVEAQARGLDYLAPPLKWCTDNAAMIALAGAMRLARGWVDDLDAPARPRWPLDQTRADADPALGAGRKGPKA
ncbi:MAG: tRNA (adenosine(37)-N6)-threonylcarbamoyltransferase complex transferase subunit TsaD [Maricaulaceae bacterium]